MYKDSQSVYVHLNNFQGSVNQLINKKMVLDDKLQALSLLNSLLDTWDKLVASLRK